MDGETEAQTGGEPWLGSEAVSRRGQGTALSLSLLTVRKTQKKLKVLSFKELSVSLWESGKGGSILNSDYDINWTK